MSNAFTLLWAKLNAIWLRFTIPHLQTQDRDELHRAQLAVTVFLVIFCVTLVTFPIIYLGREQGVLAGDWISSDSWVMAHMLSITLSGITYVVARKGYFQLASAIAAVYLIAYIVVNVLIVGNIGPASAVYVLLTLAVYSFPMWVTVGVWLIVTVALFVAVANEMVLLSEITAIVLTSGVMTVFALVLGYYKRQMTIFQNQQLTTSEQRYKIISEIISDYAFSVKVHPDRTFEPEWMTDSFEKITGYDYEEIEAATTNTVSGPTPILYHPDEWSRAFADVDRLLDGETVETRYRIITKPGEIRWLDISRLPVWDEKEQRVIRYYGVARDITERVAAETALREREERIARIIENASDVIYTLSLDGKFEYVSPNWVEHKGYTAEETLNTHFSIYIHPDDVELTQNFFTWVITSGQKQSGIEYRVRRKSGEWRWYTTSGSVARDENGEAMYYVGIAQDITERKRAEAQRLKTMLDAERFQLLQRLMVAISHDFRNTLTIIETSRHLIERTLDEENRKKVQPRLARIEEQIQRLNAQLDSIRLSASLTNLVKSEVDINQMVGHIIHRFNGYRDPALNREIVFQPTATPILSMVDEQKITEALSHLIKNALMHTSPDAAITITTTTTAGLVVIAVADTGPGIPEDKLPHVFDLFYRADDARSLGSGGLGLGLSIVKMIAEAHGGDIGVESTVGEGSTFKLLLPSLGTTSS